MDSHFTVSVGSLCHFTHFYFVQSSGVLSLIPQPTDPSEPLGTDSMPSLTTPAIRDTL